MNDSEKKEWWRTFAVTWGLGFIWVMVPAWIPSEGWKDAQQGFFVVFAAATAVTLGIFLLRLAYLAGKNS